MSFDSTTKYDLSEATEVLTKVVQVETEIDLKSLATEFMAAIQQALGAAGLPVAPTPDVIGCSVTFPKSGTVWVQYLDKTGMQVGRSSSGPWELVAGLTYIPEEKRFVGDGRAAVALVVEHMLRVAGFTFVAAVAAEAAVL